MTLVSSGNSYAFYSGDGSTTTYSLGFPFIAESHLVVNVNGSLVNTDDYTVNAGSVIFDTAPAAGADIRLSRSTPRTPLVDFQSFGSITEEELDLDQTQLIYLVQEAFETDDAGAATSGAENIVWNATDSHWEASRSGTNQQIGNVADPGDAQDAATKNYVDNVVQFGVSSTPQAWYFNTPGSTFLLENGDGLDARYLIVSIDGVLQIPFQDYTLSSSGLNPNLSLVGTGLQSGQELSVQNFGVMRNLVSTTPAPNSVTSEALASESVTAPKIAADAVTETRIEDAAVTEPKLAPDSVTSSKIADESITWDHMKESDFAPDQAGPPYPVLKLNSGGDLTIDTVDSADISDLSAFISSTPLSGLAAATGAVSMGGNPINNLPNPPPASHAAASKAYVDGQVAASTASGIELISHRTVLGNAAGNNTVIIDYNVDNEIQDFSRYEYFSGMITGFQWLASGSSYIGETWFEGKVQGSSSYVRMAEYYVFRQSTAKNGWHMIPFTFYNPGVATGIPRFDAQAAGILAGTIGGAPGVSLPEHGGITNGPQGIIESIRVSTWRLGDGGVVPVGHHGPINVTLYGHRRST